MSTANRTGHAGRPPGGTDERKPWVNPSKLTTPATTTAALLFSRDARWSPDGRLLAVVGDTSTNTPSTASNYGRTLRREGTTFTDLGSLPSLPAGNNGGGAEALGISYACAWHPHGDHLAISVAQSPFIHIYGRTGESTFTKLSNPANLPSEVPQGIAYSPDGQHLACAMGATSPYLILYSRSGDTYTKLSDPATAPAGNAISCAWSPDSQFLAVAHGTTTFVTIYQRSGTTFTKLANPASLPASTGTGAAFSPDGRYLAVGYVATPFLSVYRIDGTTFTKLANPSSLPPSNVRELSWGGPNGRHLFCSNDASPFHIVYRLDSDVLVKVPDLGTAPTALSYSPACDPSGQFLAFAGQGTARLDLYQTGG